MTHRELKGQGSDLLSQASNKQAGGLSESHILGDAAGSVWGGLCAVFGNCLSLFLSHTTFRRHQQPDKLIERAFDAGVLFLCDTLTPILLHSLGVGWGSGGNTTGREACSDCEVQADCISNISRSAPIVKETAQYIVCR